MSRANDRFIPRLFFSLLQHSRDSFESFDASRRGCSREVSVCAHTASLLVCCVMSCHVQAIVVAGKDKGPPLKLDLDISSEDLEKKLRECLASRGRKATDPKVHNKQARLRPCWLLPVALRVSVPRVVLYRFAFGRDDAEHACPVLVFYFYVWCIWCILFFVAMIAMRGNCICTRFSSPVGVRLWCRLHWCKAAAFLMLPTLVTVPLRPCPRNLVVPLSPVLAFSTLTVTFGRTFSASWASSRTSPAAWDPSGRFPS